MTYSQYLDYFEQVAIKHKQILHSAQEKRFYPIDLADLTQSLKSFGATPCIGLERPFYSTRGGHANVRLEKTGALMVFDRCSDPFDYAGMEAAYNTCYQIAEDIIAKMIKDAKVYDEDAHDYLLPGLNASTFSIEPMPPAVADGGLYGVRLSFQFNEGQDLFDVEKWNDEEDAEI
jgi:hypothetical protein